MNAVNTVLDRIEGYSFYEYFTCICDLGVFDILFERDVDVEALAKELDISKSLAVRLLRPLESLGLISSVENMTFSITEDGRMFSVHQAGNVLPQVRFHQFEGRQLWLQFKKVILEHSYNHDMEFEQNRFREYACNEKKATLFSEMMSAVSSKIDLEDIFGDYKTKTMTIVDIGGGVGTLSLAILSKIQTLKGIVFDLPHLRDGCEDNISQKGLESRCEFQNGDFFEFIPKGDIYLLSRVLHDWTDSRVERILSNIRMQMSSDSVLYIIEKIMPSKVSLDAFDEFMMDLNVFCMCGGRERTESELKKLFSKSHLALEKITDVKGSKSLKCLTVLPEE